ncbi:MAG: DUF285 domain-containing protein [Bacteroidales bacterium]|nr:DUF285 domain-containing protein [Bacteroidales bacterium]
MKKTIFTFSAIALVAFGISSCQKEEEAAQLPQQFRACADNSAKTHMGADNYTEWNSDDQIRIGFQTGTDGAVYTATPDATDATWADFSHVSGSTSGTPLYAVYPASIAQGQPGNRVNLPAVQHSADGSFAGAPMVADFSTIDLSESMPRVKFQNLCGMMKIHLQQANTNISEIAVIADQQLNGTYTISYTDGVPALTSTTATAPNTASRITTLVLGEAPSISDGKDFYIYLPAGNYTNMKLRIKNSAGNYCTKTCAAVTINRNEIVPITLGSGMSFMPPAQLKERAFDASSATSITFHYNSTVTSGTNIAESGSTPIYLVDNNHVVDVYTSASVINAPVYCYFLFRRCEAMQSIDLGVGFKTDNVQRMDYMFVNCGLITNIDLSTFNTANVVSMRYMFNECNALTSLDLSSFSSSSNLSIQEMFMNCIQLSSIKFNHNFTPSNTSDAIRSTKRGCTVYCNETLKGMLQNNGHGRDITYITNY